MGSCSLQAVRPSGCMYPDEIPRTRLRSGPRTLGPFLLGLASCGPARRCRPPPPVLGKATGGPGEPKGGVSSPPRCSGPEERSHAIKNPPPPISSDRETSHVTTRREPRPRHVMHGVMERLAGAADRAAPVDGRAGPSRRRVRQPL